MNVVRRRWFSCERESAAWNQQLLNYNGEKKPCVSLTPEALPASPRGCDGYYSRNKMKVSDREKTATTGDVSSLQFALKEAAGQRSRGRQTMGDGEGDTALHWRRISPQPGDLEFVLLKGFLVNYG